MQSFKITRDELLKFAQRLYKEGVCGYLDLCEATAESMLTDFLDGREIITPGILNESITVNSNAFAFVGATGPSMGVGMMGGSPPIEQASTPMMVGVDPAGPATSMAESAYGNDLYNATAEYRGHSGPEYAAAMQQFATDNQPDPVMAENPITMRTVTGHHVELRDTETTAQEGIVITETPVIREQMFVRTENYVGNPSERL